MIVTTKVKGLDKLAAKLKTLRGIPREVLKATVAKYALRLQGKARRLAKVDTGRLRSSILTSFMGNGLTAMIGTALGYASAVEFGRPAGATMPPGDKLTAWAARHGMREKGVGWAIARAIARRGIKPAPFLGPAFKEVAPEYVKAANEDLRDALRKTARG